MKRCKSIFFLLVLLNGSAMSQKYTIKLVDRSRSSYKIVVPVSPSSIENEAALKLQEFLFKISKCKLPIITDNTSPAGQEILIGRTNRKESILQVNINEDGVVLKTINAKLVINGGSRKGVLYSVYTFLDQFLGCKMFAKDIYYIPQNSSIFLSTINEVQNPAFEFRTTFFIESLDKNYADWHKLNYFFEGRGSFAHTLSKLMPPDKYFDEHPEYFALINGVRCKTQPCLSNKNVLQIVSDNLEKEMKENPEIMYWAVSQNDNYDFCQCNLCSPKHRKSDSFMGTLLPFVNAIAKKFPTKTISTLAYNQSFNAPDFKEIQKNVEIIVCLSTIDNNKQVGSSNDAASRRIRENISKWKNITSNIMIWDYTVCFHNSLSPYPNYFNLKPNILYYKNVGIKMLFEQGIGGMKSEFSEMRCYLLAKLMWNPNQDDRKIMDEFLEGFYGAASAKIKSYLELISIEAKNSNEVMGPWENPLSHMNSYLTYEKLNQYKSFFIEAESMVSWNSEYEQRVAREKLAIDYAMLELTKHSDQRALAIGGKKDLRAKFLKFLNECASLNIEYLNEQAVTPEAFYEDAFKRYYKGIPD